MRVDKMTEQELTLQANAVAASKDGESPVGVKVCAAALLRELRDGTERRSLCVLDDPIINDPQLPNNPAHAITIRSGAQDVTEALRIRGELLDLFGPIQPIIELYA